MDVSMGRARWWPVAACITLVLGCGGGGGDDEAVTPPPGSGNPPSNPPVSYSLIESEASAQRFLSTTTFGGTHADIDALVGRDAAEWLADEFAKPAVAYTPRVRPLLTQNLTSFGQSRADRNHHSDFFWEAAIGADDQLRQRALFALSQIVVVGQTTNNHPHRYAPYMDALYLNAFGNYRDILQDITYTPAMGRYLTYENNRKADPNTGRLPDENYAREILQLFSIGLLELNMDGTPELQGGETIETYDNDDIVNLARVFTGLRFQRDLGPDGWIEPLLMFENFHSEAEKAFLDTMIPAGTTGDVTISLALDGIFAHDNVAPFIGRQLIQRFTMSSPPPEYVERVATAFESGSFEAGNGRQFGTGQRGDMQATLAAVLLDPLMFEDTVAGKLREPVLRFVHLVRGMETTNIAAANENRLRNTSDSGTSLGQHPFRPPSVFNFYRPGYVAPNTVSGDQGMTAPELQIVNGASSIGYLNFMTDYVYDRSSNGGTDSFAPNYDPWLSLVDDSAALVDDLDLLFTGGRLPVGERSDIVALIDQMPLRTGNNLANDQLRRVQTAILLVTTSPTFAVVQ
ncbi:MAG: DUF1800 family protein [Pseudomonadota bacterium]